jgi:hypothetical protein
VGLPRSLSSCLDTERALFAARWSNVQPVPTPAPSRLEHARWVAERHTVRAPGDLADLPRPAGPERKTTHARTRSPQCSSGAPGPATSRAGDQHHPPVAFRPRDVDAFIDANTVTGNDL